ncbi:hypothetical protein [Kribbella catacumbae]|uniref:hypothetical protein n=1 Tax=Kribbella catacumbae TaxID=460086 RepID=UPI0012F792A9|nr:hypothetical protein [Kribbella catacumbae]
MSKSRAIDASHRQAFLAMAGDPDPEYLQAEAQLAAELGVELDPGEHFGEDWVLTPDETMVARCRKVIDSEPAPIVLDLLVTALQWSYHRKAVHQLLTDIARLTVTRWVAGERGLDQAEGLRDVSHAYRYGARAEDLDLILQMCNEPSLDEPGEGGELFWGSWFDSLAKMKDPRAADFCRDIIANDLGRWTDLRTYAAVPIVGKAWQPTDSALIEPIAKNHPDSQLRRTAKRILDKQT